MRWPLAILVWTLTALGAAAQPVDGATARGMLYAPDKIAVAFPGGTGLGEADRSTIVTMVQQNALKYYGAIAFSPDEGLLSESLRGAFNYHGIEAASRAALDACNSARSAGTRPCVIAAQLRPRGWRPQPVQLSSDATRGFGAYRRGRGPKAFAISPRTGEYAIAKGEGALRSARAECDRLAAQKDAADCRIVIAD